MRRRLRHGKLTVVIKGPAEAVKAIEAVDLNSYEKGEEGARAAAEAIGGDFERDDSASINPGSPHYWRAAVRPPGETPRFDITVHE